jgi:predicted nucleic acid-binding Zn ribbon protein
MTCPDRQDSDSLPRTVDFGPMSWQDEEDEEEEVYEDSDSPDESDLVDGEYPAVDACPYCGAAISELAEQCPRCKRYISREDAPPRQSKLVLWGVGLLVAALVVGLIFFARGIGF